MSSIYEMDEDDLSLVYGIPTSSQHHRQLKRRLEDNNITHTTKTFQNIKDNGVNWSKELCQDWSIKTGLRIVSSNPFGWTCNNLKLLDESSGTSAFVRCVDRDQTSCSASQCPSNCQLDGLQFIGAQFHQCCLYWQFPYLHETNLFPRNANNTSIPSGFAQSSSFTQNESSVRYGDKRSDQMYLDWMESFRSAFQLIRARQSPYFYLSTNQFTCLFSAAGMQANEDIQVSITPSTFSFRETLKAEGITFSMPYLDADDEDDEDVASKQNIHKNNGFGEQKGRTLECENDGDDVVGMNSDDEDEKWLDDLGVSQNLNLSARSKITPATLQLEKSKSNLVVIVGSKDTLTFFNFLLNSKQHVMPSAGYLAGIPPTILSPVAFLGASLRSLKLKQHKTQDARGNLVHSVDIQGPILPHVLHMLTTLLVKTIKDFKIHMSTLSGSNFLNFRSKKGKLSKQERSRPSAFHLQSLTDCGLGKNILDVFCRDDNVDSIQTMLECKSGQFQWK